MSDSKVVRTIHGVSVSFPCKPYPSQMSMMEKIIKGIEKRENCLLESPTGSGKSLALLCAALAWQKAEHDKVEKESYEDAKKKKVCTCKNKVTTTTSKTEVLNESKSDTSMTLSLSDKDDDFKPNTSFRTPCSVVTDSNVAPGQTLPAATEVAETPDRCGNYADTKPAKCVDDKACSKCYDPPKSKRRVPKIYFGTRTHKQLAQIVRELKKTVYAHVRMTVLASREHTCIHPAVSQNSAKNEGCKELLDGPGCMFKSNVQNFAYQDNVQSYMDVAWDIEDMVKLCSDRKIKACPYFSTRSLMIEADIVFCPYNYLVSPAIRTSMEISLKEQIVIFDEAHNIENVARDEMCRSLQEDEILKTSKDLQQLIDWDIKPNEHAVLKVVIDNISRFIKSSMASLQQRGYNESSKVWSGLDIIACFKQFGLGPDEYKHFTTCYNAVSSDEENSNRQRPEKRTPPKLAQASMRVVESVVFILEYMFRLNMRFLPDYKMVLLQNTVYTNVPDMSGNWLNSKRKGRKELRQVVTLNFWCMSPAVAFSDFVATRSIILTSGTLSPMQSFQSELGVEFKISLEANHVIHDSQVWVGAVGRGPHDEHLQATYKNVEQLSFQDELGHVIVSVCQAVPRGVLCFLPSYKMLENLTNRWQATGLWSELLRYKSVMCEPRASDRHSFDELITSFHEIVSHDYNDDDPSESGALFIAVCRGKVSEGMDFSDDNARAVITVGIPYPSFKDIQVELKRQYNDQNIKKGLLSGGDWYEIQAFRALNQALGRCIRHRTDWGALIMVDDRFVQRPQKFIRGLSKWVRNKACTFAVFQDALRSLNTFTNKHLKSADAKLNNSTESPDVSIQTPSSDVTSLKASTSSSRILDENTSSSNSAVIGNVNMCQSNGDSVIIINDDVHPTSNLDITCKNDTKKTSIETKISNKKPDSGDNDETIELLETMANFPSVESFNSQISTKYNNIYANKSSLSNFPTPKGKTITPQHHSTPNQRIETSSCVDSINKHGLCNGAVNASNVLSPIGTTASCKKTAKMEITNDETVDDRAENENVNNKSLYQFVKMETNHPDKQQTDDKQNKDNSLLTQKDIDDFHYEPDDWLNNSPTLFDSENLDQPDAISRSKPKLLFHNQPQTDKNIDDTTCDKSTKNAKTYANKRKAKSNTSKSDNDDSDCADFLNTKRKSAKRKSAGRRSKGIKYISDDEEEVHKAADESNRMTVSCEGCKSTLLSSTAGLTRKRCVPAFLKKLWSGRQDLYVTSSESAVHANLSSITSTVSGIELDSHWLPDYSICIQYLECVACESNCDSAVVGVKVIHSSNDSKALTGQIWLLGSAVHLNKT